ncbi:MAG: acyl carrier protein [Pirellulales bacterium]|nr:acyl carrier protein [Pirellulales bacterium]
MSLTAQTLRQFIKDNFLFGREPDFADEDSFLEMGLIDSTGVLELVAFLEREQGVTIEDRELVPENLDSINNILRFVQRKTEQANATT